MFDDHPDLVSAKTSGRMACADGKSLDANPHAWRDDSYVEWRCGWLDEFKAANVYALSCLDEFLASGLVVL